MMRNATSAALSKSKLGTRLSNELLADLNRYCTETEQKKTNVIENALGQFLALKNEELSLMREHPRRRIETRYVIRAVAPEERPSGMASVCAY